VPGSHSNITACRGVAPGSRSTIRRPSADGLVAERVQPGQLGGDLRLAVVAAPVHPQHGSPAGPLDQEGGVLADVQQRRRALAGAVLGQGAGRERVQEAGRAGGRQVVAGRHRASLEAYG
jgi:hypothetical protein